MALGDKPASLPQWADGGSAQIEVPTASKRSLGWVIEKPPFKWFNWFWNLVYLWLAWAKKYGEEHVHDGGSTDFSAPKVDLKDHVEMGSLGELAYEDDGVNGVHYIRHNAAALTLASFESDFVRARDRVRIGGPTKLVELKDEGNDALDFRLLTVEAIGGDAIASVEATNFLVSQDFPTGGDFAAAIDKDEVLCRETLPKAWSDIELEYNGVSWDAVVNRSYNFGGGMNPTISSTQVIVNVEDFANIKGQVIACISTKGSLARTYLIRKADMNNLGEIFVEIAALDAGGYRNNAINAPAADDALNLKLLVF